MFNICFVVILENSLNHTIKNVNVDFSAICEALRDY